MPAQAGGTHDSVSVRKQELRAELRRRRIGLPVAVRRRAARHAALKLMRSRLLRPGSRVALYLSHRSELDTGPLLRALQRRRVAVFVPEVLPSQRLRFVRLRPQQRLRRGPMGLRQTTVHLPCCPLRRLHALVLPLLGFDHHGHRLGQGGGYYDRALERCCARPLRIGYAYAVQEVDTLPVERWDGELDAVVTERALRRFHRRRPAA